MQQNSHPSTSHLRDLTGNAPLRQSAQAAMSVADAVQRIPNQGARLMGLAASFLMASECAGLPVNDLMGMARNCINDAGEGRHPEFAAVDAYIKNEIFNN